MPLTDVRNEYHATRLTPADLLDDPLAQAQRWVDEAVAADLPLPNAMALATVAADGQPSSRIVLLKGVDARGFTFFTHHDSRKGSEMATHPQVSFVMLWPAFDRQLVVMGSVEQLSVAESRAYFASRPHGSQLSAVVSPQSRPVAEGELELAMQKLARELPEGAAVPMPASWGGYRVLPTEMQFWHGQPSRLHDRFRYCKQTDGRWLRDRLAP